MKSPACILLCSVALAAWAAADLPKKAPLTKYSSLIQSSPFTSKPPPAAPVQMANPLEDYSLSGVSPIAGGYQVTLINKKNPEERIPVRTNETNKQGFKILEVNRKEGNPLGTTVRISSGVGTGTVAFDEKYLTLITPPAAKPQANPQPQVGAAHNPATQPNTQLGRQPRPRVVPPPQPGGAQGTPFQPGGQQSPAGGNRFDRKGGPGGFRR